MMEEMKIQSFVIGAGKSKPQFNGTVQKFKFNGNEIVALCREAQDQQKEKFIFGQVHFDRNNTNF